MLADYALKVISDTGDSMRVAGYGIVFGGQDLAAERFTAQTALWLGDGLSATPPVLFGHGQDETFGATILGHVVKTRVDEAGVWIEAQLEASKRYLELIRQLIAKGIPLGWSSGSISHLVQRKKSSTPGVKEISVWPVAEWSLVTQPCEPRTLGIRELKALATTDKRLRAVIKEAGGTSLQEASYEDLQGDLRDAAAAALGVQFGVCVCATYPDHVIVSVESDMDMPGQPDDEEDSAYWDFPYTIGSDGEPVLGTPKPVQQAFVAGAAKATLTSNARNNLSAGQFAYTDSSGTGHLPVNDAAHVRAALSRFNQTSFESPAKKKAAARKILARARAFGIEVSSDSAVAMAAKDGGKSMDLDDSAYAFVEDGGTLIEGKSFPLEKRHYQHHDASGTVDPTTLAEALSVAAKVADPRGYAHLLRHKRAIDTGLPDDAHEAKWQRGNVATLLVAYTKGLALVEEVAADLDSMKRSGLDTHDDQRLYAHRAAELKTNHSSIGQPLEWAENIDRGDDGKARVDMFRHRLALLELEEVH